MAKIPVLCVWTFALTCLATSAASGQPSTTPPAAGAGAPQQAQDDDDAALRPAEPEYRLINLPTTLRLPKYRSNFDLTHRFNGNLRQGSFGDQASDLFGIDDGAVIGIEFRFAVARHVQAVAYRTNFDKTVQFHGKWDAISERGSMPLSVSAVVSIEGTNNFKENRAPALGAVVSRTIDDRVALYVTPIWVHNSAASSLVTRDTFVVGLGGRVRVRPTVYLVGETSPRMSGYQPGKAEFAFGIEKRAGLHVFQLNVTNTQATTFAQLARGGFPDSLYLGFNLARKFF